MYLIVDLVFCRATVGFALFQLPRDPVGSQAVQDLSANTD